MKPFTGIRTYYAIVYLAGRTVAYCGPSAASAALAMVPGTINGWGENKAEAIADAKEKAAVCVSKSVSRTSRIGVLEDAV